MNWKVVFTRQALTELDDIYGYIANVLLEPKIAYSLYELIIREVKKLNYMPMRNPLFDENPWRDKGIRK